MSPPNSYRMYRYNAAQHTLSGDWLKATTDDEAIAEAEANGPGSVCEIWDGERLVARLGAERRQA